MSSFESQEATQIECEERETAPASSRFDPSAYRQYLATYELSDAQSDELLCALWAIMCSFVDLGWGADPLSLVFGATSPSEVDEPILPSGNDPSDPDPDPRGAR